MKIQVNDVEPHVPRPHLAEDGIQVGTVIVEQAARIMHDLLDIKDSPLEDAERRRVRKHDASRVRSDGILQGLDINIAVCAGRNFRNFAATHGRCRRVCAMRGVRDDNLIPFSITIGDVVGTNHCNASQFTLRTGHRRQ